MDGYAVLGPWMVTADEVPNVDDVPLSLKVNGELRQQCNTKDLVFSFRKLIEYASSYYTLYPGDCFYSGTTSGVGPVKPGDVITVESPLIGRWTCRFARMCSGSHDRTDPANSPTNVYEGRSVLPNGRNSLTSHEREQTRPFSISCVGLR